MGVTKTRTTAYPQSDGQTERQNRTLQTMLALFVSDRKHDWDLWIDNVVYAYNTSRHESLGVSPYEVVFGRPPRLPLELQLGIPLSNPSVQSDYIRSLKSFFQNVREIARTTLSQARAHQPFQTQSREKTWKTFHEGQVVMIKRPKG